MFRHEQADLIETYLPALQKSLPALQKSVVARLDLRLYTEAMAERTHDVQFLRHWAILEMIASRHISSTKIKIKNWDGSAILTHDGKARTTYGKSEKVYQYLFQVGVNSYSFGWKTRDGLEVHVTGTNPPVQSPNVCNVSLWEILRAAYRIRNAVAHGGFFTPNPQSGDWEEYLAALMFTSGPFSTNFLAHVTRAAIFRELGSVVV
ncbi:MAG: hypothetical protein HZA66_01565 [Rhodopseudomonas palustris]|uniref:Uncharacterized protein n=1 Tax=Rhodopseudomonas palustris TaxID=1076 RepID=A0A933VZR0_RHOPL|nr:hypothetical protein [Rhodopseudomonas palustris]